MDSEEIVLNNIIGSNPTGTLDFSDTYTMVGPNSIVQDSNTASHNNLNKTSQNQIVCNAIENFDNYNKKINKEFILIILFLVILLILYFL